MTTVESFKFFICCFCALFLSFTALGYLSTLKLVKGATPQERERILRNLEGNVPGYILRITKWVEGWK